MGLEGDLHHVIPLVRRKLPDNPGADLQGAFVTVADDTNRTLRSKCY
jgi:hypothetical protein